MAIELERRRFAGPEEFRAWLVEHQHDSPGLILVLAKKGAPGLTYAGALDVALAFGWIDGQVSRLDDEAFLQRFTPRRPKSLWSARNVRFAEEMIAAGRMEPRGLAEVEKARADGRWERAYEGSKNAEPHPDFLAALAANDRARTFYDTLTSQNRYAIYFRIHDAKRDETRARRIAQFIDMLERGEKLY